MHVAQLLYAFARTPDIEIVETMLPNVLASSAKQFLLAGGPGRRKPDRWR